MEQGSITRRGIIAGTAGGLLALPVAGRTDDTTPAAQGAPTAAGGAPSAAAEAQPVVLAVNGQPHRLTLDPRVSLLDALRDHIGLTGTKKGCDRGACGACTVHLDGRRVVSCLTLAVRCQGKAVTTIEGLAQDGHPHPLQAAFVAHDGFQCGYCTPGQIMSAAALLHEGHAGSATEIRAWMSGNICRCGAYPNIVAAIRDVAAKG
jgi:xanthine dehydrogenase YagT iron-sulfur-binding subunit